MRLLKLVFPLLALTVLSGCHATLAVQTYSPAPSSLGAVKRLSLVETTGRRSAREEIVNHALNIARSHGYFQVKDRSEEGITMKVAGRTVSFTGATPLPDEAFVKIDVHSWDTRRDPVKTKDGNGNETTRHVPTATVVLGITVATASGKAVLAEKEFKWEWFHDTESTALAFVAERVVRNFLNEVTPVANTSRLRLDDGDEGQAGILKTAQAGNLAQAIKETRDYVEKNPLNGAAVYNLAVYLDASGEYAEALTHYADAISKSANKGWYADTKVECGKRQAAVLELTESTSR